RLHVSNRSVRPTLEQLLQLVCVHVGGTTPSPAPVSSSCGIHGMRLRCSRRTTSKPASTASPTAEI
ncbi:hypothetical protein ANCDUO_26768, partial [Ancylostoma duodenale]